jgi:hypothetical protein
VIQSPPPTTEYLDWSEQYIGFGREDHPVKVPRPGHSALIVDARIGGYDCSKVFLDAGSSINLIYANTLCAMNISMTNLVPSDIGFHGIVPGNPEIPMGRITLEVIFETPENFRKEKIEFEVIDWPSQFRRPAYSWFMMVSHHTYLVLKMPEPNGVITVKGNFTRFNACNMEFHKLSESFGMQAEYRQLQDYTDYGISPDVR